MNYLAFSIQNFTGQFYNSETQKYITITVEHETSELET